MHKASKQRYGREHPSTFNRLPLAAAIYLAVSSIAFAQDAASPQAPEGTTEERAATLDTVTVTAQKRSENLQKVPISIDVLGEQKLDELNVADFNDYVRFLPSVSYQSAGPGFAQIYMRGVASGGDGNHSGPLPSVGIYLDEQPITTIQGPLDLHIYDINRVEALAGPQGTLYGASSQAGTLRIITNKPDPGGFAAGYAVEANTISGGGTGYVNEGFVNIPIAERAAIRLVGWDKREAGYIDNRPGTRTFPSWGGTLSNGPCTSTATLVCTGRAEDNYNDVRTTGARAALKVDLNDNWTVTASLIGQRQKTNGSFAFDPAVGDLALTHFYPEKSDDRWNQSALTVQGKIGNFDLTYAFAYLKRDVDSESDYNDYSFWYDTLLAYGAYITDDSGNLINPSQYIQGVDGYKKTSHELRISSPQEDRLRFVAGVFVQDQKHDIQQRYRIDGLSAAQSVTGWEDTLWLTKQLRRDKDSAVFGEVSFDFTDKLTATAGARFFKVDNSLKGFFGFADWGWSSTGEASCFAGSGTFNGAPCVNLDKRVKEDGTIGRFNLTYEIDDKKMIYGTWSEGFRPGGINRRGTLPPYLSDYLTNYEFGWKTSWADNTFRFNGSIFQQDWKDFQFAILGQNGLTEIKNANQARIRGFETDMTWAVNYNFQLSGGFAFYKAELTENYCGFTDTSGTPFTVCPPGTINPQTGEPVDGPEAPSGTQLPITARFKGNLIGRYSFNLGSLDAYVQGALMHEGKRKSDLRLVERQILGDLDAYTVFDLSAGIRKNNWALDLYLNNVFDERAELVKFAQCAETVCGAAGVVPEYPNGQVYTVPNQPRTFGIRFSQNF